MRLRQLVLACGLASLALSSHVSALGLGEVKLKSTLNQPLEAEVKLLDTRDLTAEQILVTLASPADFERNGVDRLFFYTEFQFAVDLESPDGPKVLITSRNPVREPYLNFLIEARWTAGRLLREYTLLMDLPTFEEDGAARAVQSATTAAPKAVSRPAASEAPATNQAPSARVSSGSGSGSVSRKPALSSKEYEVRGNDTLWEIALRARPDSSVSVHQSMMALYKANPDAFISGNINRLRRGQVLRVPDAEEMKSLGKSEAVSQFAAASGDSALGAQINASRRASTSRSESTEVSGRVKLAAPSASGGTGQGSGANDGSGKALESELATTLEELDKSKAENTELSSRVKDLESQIETMQRLVDVSNEKLRALQVAAEQKPADTSAQITTPTEAVSAPTQEVSAQEVAPVEQVAIASAAASSAPAAAKPVVPPKVVKAPPPEPTLADTAIQNAPWIGLGVLGLAGAGYFAYRRRKQQAEEQQTFEQEEVFAIDETPHDSDEPADAQNNLHEIDETSLFDEDQPASAVAETGDVVGEADIYIAYGKLDQAEEMLLNALKKDPDSADIRMKLLEVYAQQQNASGFDKHYAALLPIAGAALLSRASELRAGISGVGEFDSGAAVAASESADDFSLDDFSLDDDLSVSEPQPQSEAVAGGFEPGDFDFKLDLDDEEPQSASVDLADDFALDLDDSPVAKDVDDISELSLALDELTGHELPEDVEAASASIADEFNFDLDEDLALDGDLALDEELALDDELLSGGEAVPANEQSLAVGDTSSDSLDVPADDFNLDMNVDDIDLAALDHEMESLDVDFDDESLDSGVASISEFAAQEIAKDQADFELDLDEDMQLDDLSPSNLKLTDDLDSSETAINFELEDDVTFEGELEANFSADTDFALHDEGGVVENETLDFTESVDDAPVTSMPEFSVAEFEADESLSDLDAAFGGSSIAAAEDVLPEVDLELDEEIPGAHDTMVAGGSIGIDESVPFESATDFGAPAEEQHDEDLFSQALSEFSSESDDLDLNEFSSDEAALADLTDDDMDSELDFLADADEAATKLDLARAYIDMGDTEGAKDILSEVIGEGNDEQRNEANELLGRIV